MSTRFLLGICLVGCVACGSDHEKAPAGAGGSSGTDSGAGGSGALKNGTGGGGDADSGNAGKSVSISGLTHDWNQENPFDGAILPGVKVCVYEHPEIDCSTSGADGAWKVEGVPEKSDVSLTFEKTGFVPLLRAVRTAAVDVAIAPFENPQIATSQIAELLPGKALDPKKGSIIFFMNGPGTRFQNAFDWVRGFTAKATPQAGDGPFYSDTHHVLAPAATQSIGGYGVFLNAEPGTYDLEFTPPAGATCGSWTAINFPEAYGFPAAAPLTVGAPVVGGYITTPVGFYCPALPDATDAGP